MHEILQWFGIHAQTPKMAPSTFGRNKYKSEAILIKYPNGLEPMLKHPKMLPSRLGKKKKYQSEATWIIQILNGLEAIPRTMSLRTHVPMTP